jgi:hypothetical protein
MPVSDPFVDFLITYGIYLIIYSYGINIGLSFIGAAIAGKKGYSYGGFLCLGIFVAFWLSLIIAASVKPRAGSRYLEQRYQQQQHAQPNQYQPMAQNAQPAEGSVISCTGCGASVASDMAFCSSCGKQNPGKPTA